MKNRGVSSRGGAGLRYGLLAAAVAAALGAGSARAQAQAAQVVENAHLGGSLYEIVMDGDDDRVLVADAGGRGEGGQSYIYSLDATTLEVIERIALDEGQAFGLALDEQGDRLYMVDTRGAALSALDIESGEVAATLSLADDRAASGEARPPQPRLALFEPDSGRVYVSGVADEGVIWVVNGADMTLETTFENVGSRPAGLALESERERLYTTLLGSDQVAVIDTNTGEVVETLDLTVEGAINLALDRGRQRLLVTGQQSGELEVLDAADGRSLARIATGEGALDVAINEGNNRIYVTNRGAGTVTVIDAEHLETVATLETGPRPNSVTVDPEHHTAFVTNRDNREAPDKVRGNAVSLIR